jgi:RimJ/RimL family protein N-acetyltransferase
MDPIATAHFDLRLLDAGDEALYAALYGDPETMAHVAAAQEPERLASGFAATCRANAASPPRRRTWVIRDRATGRDLGLIGLVWDAAGEADRQSAELGVMLPPQSQGRGVASEAIAGVCGAAFARLGLDLLHTWHREGHALAEGLMRHVGFVAQPTRDGEGGQHWQLTREQAARRDALSAPAHPA